MVGAGYSHRQNNFPPGRVKNETSGPGSRPKVNNQSVMKNSFKLILSLTGLVLLAAPVLRADEPVTPPADQPDRHEWRKEHRGEMRERFQHMAKELNLTADQQAQAEGIFKQTGDAVKVLHADPSLTEDQKHAKMQELRKSTRDQLHALLTPEQQAKAKELRAKHGRHGDQPPVDKPQVQ